MSNTEQLAADDAMDGNLLSYIFSLSSILTSRVEEQSNEKLVALPEEYDLRDVSEYKESPDRIQENLQAHTIDGFLSYVERFSGDETTIFVDPTDGTLRAVFDYHHPEGGPQHADHSVAYSPSHSDAWDRWVGVSGNLMRQRDFAEFIEEHVENIANPTGSEMLTVARNLNATRNVEFKSSRQPDTGDVQLKYQEETDGSVGESGEIDIPEFITLSIPVFEGGMLYEVKCRLRYRIKHQNLKMGIKILRKDDLIEDAIELYLQEVEHTVEEVPVHEVALM